MTLRCSRAIFAALAVCAPVLVAPGAAAQPVLIEAAWYLDVEAGETVANARILVEDGEIAAVNSQDPPDDARRIDLGDRTVLPGLFDVHTHLTYAIGPGWETEAVRFTAGDYALRGAMNAKKTLDAGFTTVRDLSGPDFADVALAEAIEKGWVAGPDVHPAGNAISITGGHCDITGFAPDVKETGPRKGGVADGADEVLEAVRYQVKHGAKTVKVCATAGVLSFEGPVGAQQMSMAEMRAAAEEAHRHGKIVAAHAHGTEGIIAAAKAGIDSIEHNTMMTEEAAEVIKEEGAYVVPNLYLTEAIDMEALPPLVQNKMRQVAQHMAESYRRALEHDLKIVFGTDAAVFPHGENAREFAERVALGQSEIGAIRAATTVAAEMMGLEDRGRIAEGLRADLIAVEGDPLEDISVLESVEFVMKEGIVHKRP